MIGWVNLQRPSFALLFSTMKIGLVIVIVLGFVLGDSSFPIAISWAWFHVFRWIRREW